MRPVRLGWTLEEKERQTGGGGKETFGLVLANYKYSGVVFFGGEGLEGDLQTFGAVLVLKLQVFGAF